MHFINQLFKNMKKIIMMLVLSASFCGFAQNRIISVSFGASSPLSDYAKTDMNSTKSGFATLGSCLNLNGVIKIRESWGISGTFGRQTNGYDSNPIKDALQEQSGTSFSVTAKDWSIIKVMAGLYCVRTFGERFSVDLKLLAGLSSVSSPELKITAGNYFSNMASKSATGFSSSFGIGLNYNLTEKWLISAGFNYYNTTIDFKDVQITDISGTSLTSYSQPINTFNFDFGLGFRF